MVVAILAFAGMFLATYLTLYKMGVIGELRCTIGECETVNTSRWAVLLGAPVAAWGVAFYVALFSLAMLGISERYQSVMWVSKALVGLTLWGAIFSAWLSYLELFVIHAICIWCVTSAALVTLAFGTSLLDWREKKLGRTSQP